jgi:AAHS family benzoate transporter-like MFS transporter
MDREDFLRINVQSVADDAKFGRKQLLVLIFCFVNMMLDGYDLTVIGVALPSIITEMKMDPSVAGLLVSAALIGMLVGAAFFGIMADKVGRVKTMATCIALFSIFTAAAGLCREPTSFAASRFLAGLGLGGVVPLLTAIMSEYSPKAQRSFLMTVMFSGYSLGGVLAALLGKQFMEAFGWQIVFFAAGLPVLLVPVVLSWLPESLSILERRGDRQALRKVARELDPSVKIADTDEVFAPIPKVEAKVPVARLFQDSRGFSTVMLWIGAFCGLFMLYALNAWLTKLMAMAGYSVGSALTFLLLLNFGSMAGSFAGGWLSDRFGLKPVLATMLAIGSVATMLMAVKLDSTILMTVIFIVGVTASAGQGLMFTLVAQFYPADVRATAVGVTSSMGRFGGIFSPIIIGILISLSLPYEQNFYVIASFGLVQALTVMLVSNKAADYNAARVTA